MRAASQRKRQREVQPRRKEILVIRGQAPVPEMPKKKNRDFFRLMLELRAKSLLAKLKQLHPEVFDERKHEENGAARDYWHYGYLAALKDFHTLVKRGRWPLEAFNPDSPLDLPDED